MNLKNITIKQRIYWSFSLLIFLFIINGIITVITINSIKKTSSRLSKVVDPSLRTLDDFRKLIVESKMYTTNWVFLRANQEDKKSLAKLHSTDYTDFRQRMSSYTKHWTHKDVINKLDQAYKGFEELMAIEKNIMTSLRTFSDYDDPVIKLEAERKIEEEILPRTSTLLNNLNTIYDFGKVIRARETARLDKASMNLRIIITVLILTIIGAGIILSRYMSKAIIGPVERIKHIINDLGRGIIQAIPKPSNKDEIGAMIRSVNNLSRKLSVTADFAHKIGNRNFSTHYEPLSEDDTLGHALITMRDNLKRNDEKLEMQRKELERKNKELEQFVYIASHDLQEPLRTTSSFVNLLQQQYQGKLDGHADKYLTYIHESSDRMKILINDLLDYSRIGNKKNLENVDCNIILEQVLADMGKTIEETNAEIRSEQLPIIQAYKTEIKQLFQNLIINAIKFRKKDSIPKVIISATRNPNSWTFSVKDNGIGIAEAHKERIFIIFQRLHTRTEYEGSGIGLAHCKKIVGLHGGKIWIDSIVGEGTIFHFNIPEINN